MSNDYGVEAGQIRRPASPKIEKYYVKILRELPSGNYVIERSSDNAKTEMDPFKISYRYPNIDIEKEEDNGN